jgi:hypothetical protein
MGIFPFDLRVRSGQAQDLAAAEASWSVIGPLFVMECHSITRQAFPMRLNEVIFIDLTVENFGRYYCAETIGFFTFRGAT